jgi:hypothetical protein
MIFFKILKLVSFTFFGYSLSQTTTTTTTTTCNTITFRKEVRQMHNENEFSLFTRAFKIMATDGSLARFINIHGQYWDHAHFNPRFLPWHRLYLQKFEQELQKRGCPYLPYWDWSLDSQDPLHSIIFSNEFFGKNDPSTHEIVDGPFSRNQYKTPVGNHNLIRDYNINQKATFYHPSLLVKEMDKDTFSQWSRNIEYGPHASVHSTLGGRRGDMSKWTAGNDPLFWLHHSFIDKLWYEFQFTGFEMSFDGEAYGTRIDSTFLLLPWNVLINDTLDIQNLCIDYNPIPTTTSTTTSTIPQPTQDNGVPTTNITQPVINDEWFNNSNVNKTAVEEVKNKTLLDTIEINNDIQSGKTPIQRVDKDTVPKSTSGVVSFTFRNIDFFVFNLLVVVLF